MSRAEEGVVGDVLGVTGSGGKLPKKIMETLICS